MTESTSFRWTREDGFSVLIENNTASAYDASGNELAPDSDTAIELFVESSMVIDEMLPIRRIKGDDDNGLRYRLLDAFRMMRRPERCMPPVYSDHMMFGGPMMFHNSFSPRPHRHWTDKYDEEKDPEELMREFRKEEMEMMRSHRDEERAREARRRQEIIDTATPYEAPEVCPDRLLDENSKYYIEEKGSTIVTVGHDTENYNMFNIVNSENKFCLPRHRRRIERITTTRFLLMDENDKWEYYDISSGTSLFSADKNIVNVIDNTLTYSDDTHTFCYDTDGNLIAKVSKDLRLSRIVGGRPVVERRLNETDSRNNPHYVTVSNLILPDGSYLFSEWQYEISGFNFPRRFLALSQDMHTSIYSDKDFSLVYKSERPRRLQKSWHRENAPDNELFILNTLDDDFERQDSGIIVNVLTGEVISKDKDGNPADFARIEYPEYTGKNWKAEVSVKTHRMEPIDPQTGKRIRRKNKA